MFQDSLLDRGLSIISNTALLGQCCPVALARLVELARPRTFAAGEVLVRQGVPAECLHVLVRGRVAVARGHPDIAGSVTLAVLGQGATVGELGLHRRAPYAATVTAVAPTETLALSLESLMRTLVDFPSPTVMRALDAHVETSDELARYLARTRLRLIRGADHLRRQARS